MLADDGYQWFVDNGGLTRANGDRFRQHGPLSREHPRSRKDVRVLARRAT